MRPTKTLSALKYALQFLFLVFSVLMIAEGFWGSQFAPKNLTALFVWVHYRGFLVLALLFWGNLFCMACPFIFVRNAMRVLIAPKFLWPKKRQNKWMALCLFSAALFFYEYLNLWSNPKATAVLIVLFFLGALFTDLLFKKATFCKYVCPIGQFNFLSSTLSPKVVRAKKLKTCETCTTQDCLRGRTSSAETLRGCELGLFMPKKHGSLDCTFCMDCISACPHNNIELASIVPGSELWTERHRSGIGVLSNRVDMLALIIAFLFLGLLNAFLMTAPAFFIKEKCKLVFGIQNEFVLLLFLFLLFLLVLPPLLLGIPEVFSRKASGKKFRLVPSLVPLGLGIWTA
ncbi:MAG: 4Fe-4S binding protein, partial [Bacteriovorax sp.]